MKKERATHSLKQQIEAFEQDLIENALRKFAGNINQAAFYLRMKRTTLFEKMKKYNTKEHMKKEIKFIIKAEWLNES